MHYLRILILFLFFTSCGQDLPDCIEEQIDEFKSEQETCKGAKVEKYIFKEQTVYALQEGNCVFDAGIAILNENCVTICFLYGISGDGYCEGLHFVDNATLDDVIWEQ